MSKLLAMMMSQKVEEMPLTVVGYPTITDGVVSGFSSSDYVEKNSFGFVNSFSGKIRAKIDSDTTVYNGLFQFRTGGTGNLFSLENYGPTAIRIYHYDISSSSNKAEAIYNLSLANKWIDYYFDYNNDTKILNVYGKENNTTIFTKTYNNTEVTGTTFRLGLVFADAFNGEIDINNSNMEIDGTKYIFTV